MNLFIRTCLLAVTLIGAVTLGTNPASAEGDYCGPYSNAERFYNYYAPPVACAAYPGAVGAQLYVSPRPVPPLVGHTYITYQPLLPHEFLYQHKRTYYRNHGPHGCVTKTKVTWW